MKTEQEKVLDIINNAMIEMDQEVIKAQNRKSFGEMWMYKLIRIVLATILLKVRNVYNN